MIINDFLNSLHTQDKIYVVYPRLFDIEDYVMDLEARFYKKYHEKLQNKEYISFSQYKQNEQFYEDKPLLVDPQCWQQEIKNAELVIEEIINLCQKYKQIHHL